ncbi:MAG: hypothetical protein J6J23_01985 [Clostridia bacterium]|nr:hypothetical protein [Clostridia bacterium]
MLVLCISLVILVFYLVKKLIDYFCVLGVILYYFYEKYGEELDVISVIKFYKFKDVDLDFINKRKS